MSGYLNISIVRNNVTIGNNVIIHPNVVINEGVRIADGVEIYPGAIIGKQPQGSVSSTENLIFLWMLKLAQNTSIGPNSIIYYDVIIGADCLIGDAVAISEKCIIGPRCIIGRNVSLLYNVIVGECTKIMTNSHITGNSIVGRDVVIGVGVNSVNDNNFGSTGYDRKEINGPVIEDNVKIGAGATLLPNITIGKNAVVGAG
ncbi:MAG: DapH/DapD/GlmU-related protein [Bacteroidales bacterium]|nr:DapH/DapD/GlmU-related protein [Bacteroidales bacterium]